MPVRSLRSSVLRWPSRDDVATALGRWVRLEAEQRPMPLRIAYFGSYARGDWGVGSDLDLVAIVTSSQEPFERRANSWDLSALPVPAELLVYTVLEWRQLQIDGSRFGKQLGDDTVWVWEAGRPVAR